MIGPRPACAVAQLESRAKTQVASKATGLLLDKDAPITRAHLAGAVVGDDNFAFHSLDQQRIEAGAQFPRR